ncbi:isochorismatase [Pestalotiopsis sp. NC0098]|nr:isochorismatase [Pestalotiopsis sp. NC0098]
MLQGIDPSLFPVLKTRKALLIVDAQNDFISKDGALPVAVPDDLTGKIARAVKGFRPYGDIVWIRSQYSQPRHPKSEQVITSDPVLAASRQSPASRGRKLPLSGDQPPSRCPEAFLSGQAPGRPECVRAETVGGQFPAEIQQLIEKKDMSFIKSYYSAFQIPDLIQRLRMKFVSEVFVCGSLTNMGIMATAIDAGSHGLDIGIIEDCCGYRDKPRHNAALARIQEMTGCEILSTDQILDRLKPKPKMPRMAAPIPNPTGRRYPVVYEGPSTVNSEDQKPKESVSSRPSDLASSMTKMSLADDTDSSLPPITFTRARTAVRGNPTRPLPDVGKRLNEQFNILGGMNASPNDDLNANSGDESPNEGPTKTPATTQPPSSARAGRQEKSVERTQGAVDPTMAREKDIMALPLQTSATNGKEPDPATVAILPGASISDIKEADETPKATPIQNRPIDSIEEAQEIQKEAIVMDPVGVSPTASEPLCEGDTMVLYNVLPQPIAENVFDMVRTEVDWQRMSHQGGEVPRLVAVQGEVDAEGNIPVYRHPSDESPPLRLWTTTVKNIRDEVEKQVGHPLNHALIQFYRDGSDYISEHSDKTLDIVRGSYIVNVSLGAERTMVLRTKRQPKAKDGAKPPASPDGTKRETQRARLPHNSMCKMGLQTNMRWLHAIRQDKRLDRDKTEEELAYNGARISLTFRQIGTFLDQNQKTIWGQGAKAKSKAEAHEVINGQSSEAIKMIQAFGRENQSTDFDWQAQYGPGFDVLHISAAPRLFTSSDPVANMRVQLMLAELGVDHAKGSSAAVSTDRSALQERAGSVGIPVKFVDNDEDKCTVLGDVAIMMYLDRFYGQQDEKDTPARADTARALTRFNEALSIGERRLTAEHADLKRWLDPWEMYAGEADFIAGSSIGIADFAFWPVLYDIVEGHWNLSYPNLKSYYDRIRGRDTVVKIYGRDRDGKVTSQAKRQSLGAESNGTGQINDESVAQKIEERRDQKEKKRALDSDE